MSRHRKNVQHFFLHYVELVKAHSTAKPEIINCFPVDSENVNLPKLVTDILEFVFPCDIKQIHVEKFSFVMTSEEGYWTYGFVRHEPDLHALVFLSYLPYHETFYRLLDHLADKKQKLCVKIDDPLHIGSMSVPSIAQLLVKLYNKKPFIIPADDMPSIPSNINLTELYSTLSGKSIVTLLAAILCERQILFVANRISRLSACIQAMNKLLFPLEWQHIFIPILPNSLHPYLLAPMPYIIGLPRDEYNALMDTGGLGDSQMVVADLDKDDITTFYQDKLPKDMTTFLLSALHDKDVLGDSVSKAFLKVFVYILGNYRQAFRLPAIGEEVTFDKNSFVANGRKSFQLFLTNLVNTQLFQQFVDGRIDLTVNGALKDDPFEKALARMPKLRMHLCYLTKSKTKVAAEDLLNKMRNKAQPVMASAVNSVKLNSSRVKLAYRGIKSRFEANMGHPNLQQQRGTVPKMPLEESFDFSSDTEISSGSSVPSDASTTSVHGSTVYDEFSNYDENMLVDLLNDGGESIPSSSKKIEASMSTMSIEPSMPSTSSGPLIDYLSLPDPLKDFMCNSVSLPTTKPPAKSLLSSMEDRFFNKSLTPKKNDANLISFDETQASGGNEQDLILLNDTFSPLHDFSATLFENKEGDEEWLKYFTTSKTSEE